MGDTRARAKPTFHQFGRRFAVKLGELERSIIDTSLTQEEVKKAFHLMDENNGKLSYDSLDKISDKIT